MINNRAFFVAAIGGSTLGIVVGLAVGAGLFYSCRIGACVRRSRDFRNKAIRALRANGARVTSVTQNKHTRIKFSTDDGAGQISIASTPSDVRAEKNVAADIRRKLTEIAVRTPKPGLDLLTDDNTPINTSSSSTPARIRQAPFPARSRDAKALFPIAGGMRAASRRKRRLKPTTRSRRMCL